MKRSIVAIAVLFVTLFSANINANAQTSAVKIGYANIEYIVSVLPEAKQVNSDLQAHQTQLQNQYQAKMQELQKLFEDYQKGAATMDAALRSSKEAELQNRQEEINKFQQDAQISISQKQQQLFQPLFTKASDAIKKVAEANGYTHVLSMDAVGSPVLLYAREEDNISNLVLKELGVTPPPVPNASSGK
ncbi:OmpH family outer membrane protein [Xanthovirga aplysinae]|uniref:OmpH family outer membrane protein n=1 Tax=Xanthovirga aplysinae TaxID=2529853 RepID=UPI0012BBECD9|nr:OmpH family outer membrane protein [Xanthovirga aplysinae]MTI31651.1 OmpH family outer membrane protein [Xanthovirga aplysinae]